MLESDVYKMLEDIEGSLIDIEMKSPRINIIEMENLRNYITRIKKEISRSFRRHPQDF